MLGMNKFYSLQSSMVIRREHYGVMTFDPYCHRYRHYNNDALKVMECLQQPITIKSIKRRISGHIDWFALLNIMSNLRENGVIHINQSAPAGRILYLDRERFRSDCLVAPGTVTSYITEGCGKHCRH